MTKEETAKIAVTYLRALADRIEAGEISDLSISHDLGLLEYQFPGELACRLAHSGREQLIISYTDSTARTRTSERIAHEGVSLDAESLPFTTIREILPSERVIHSIWRGGQNEDQPGRSR